MIKKTLYFGNPVRLSRKDAQLTVEFPEDSGQEKRTIPIEDIGIIVLDDPQILIGQALLSSLLDNNVAVLCTNSSHMPAGMFLNMQGHTEMAERHGLQIEASAPLKKNLWQQTVQQKIINQAGMLRLYDQPFQELIFMAGKVKSGDIENKEGHAAAFYWRRLFDPEMGFKRGRFEEGPNKLLNYGYAILRAVVARSLCGSGLLCSIGIHHRNKYNPFCLADDIMEPYRPYVDKVVCEIVDSNIDCSELTPELKRILLQIPAMDVQLEGETSPLMVAMQRTTASLARCFEGTTRKIVYPQLE
ncbi:MAG: type II CRISPR-associated endonuclease Cas1 [Flavobacteriales bacterium]|nr:type II CRISPR-associated endonuclease Cas1 [Flavobacteriales bacterium]